MTRRQRQRPALQLKPGVHGGLPIPQVSPACRSLTHAPFWHQSPPQHAEEPCVTAVPQLWFKLRHASACATSILGVGAVLWAGSELAQERRALTDTNAAATAAAK